MCQKEHEMASSGKKNRVSQTTHCFNGGLNALDKYESKWESSPIFGMKIKNISNHHPVES